MRWAGKQFPQLKVAYVNFADTSHISVVDQIKQNLNGRTLWDIMQGGEPWLICVDAAQMSYDQSVPANAEFWDWVKSLQRSQLQLNTGHGIRVVLAATYGTKRSLADAPNPTSPLSMPVRIEDPDAVITAGMITTCLDYLKQLKKLKNELAAPDVVNRQAM
ncbi:hypothetical protein WJX72_007670 [[Myrmecia] bisecta]|uniref:Uncharacterized protein n=1 Tax=[Myrmecia] bisecta TaxID=41462 RepID=A0AAW1QFP1_9CHLO